MFLTLTYSIPNVLCVRKPWLMWANDKTSNNPLRSFENWLLCINQPRPHSIPFKASSHQQTISYIFLEIPEVGRVCSLLLLLLLQAPRQETHLPFYKRKTHDLQVICSGRTFSISLWYRRKVFFRSMSKIRLDKQRQMYMDCDVSLETKRDRNRGRSVPY